MVRWTVWCLLTLILIILINACSKEPEPQPIPPLDVETGMPMTEYRLHDLYRYRLRKLPPPLPITAATPDAEK
jgi:hypothetical protein